MKLTQSTRVKRRLFPISTFVLTFLLFALLTTLQMKIIGNYIEIERMPSVYRYTIISLWLIGALFFTLFTRYQVNKRYEKPIQAFVEATEKVAKGDFSVYVAPRHTADKRDELDIIFEDFNKMVEELGSIETLKVDFFSNVSHEIKTPIATIQNYAELIRRGNSDKEQTQEYADNIIQSAKRLANLITNMLKLNKLEKQTIAPVPENFDLSAQLCEGVLQFETLWEEKGIELIVEVEDEAPIIADKGLLEIVWNNLFSNAFKFTASGGEVFIGEKKEGNQYKITIKDSGCGMDEQTKARIFNKFYQGDTSHSTEGNGLGLAMVKRILELEDGDITVNSSLGKGTIFEVTLPVVKEE